MKPLVVLLALSSLALADIASPPRRSLLDSDPEVIYLHEHLTRPLMLRIVKEAPIFADKDGQRRLASVVTGQTVELQAMTERAYRVSAMTSGSKVLGWVPPWAFESKDPDFVEHLAQFYKRQMEVQMYINNREAAIGMTMDEVGKALGKPTKTTVRKTEKGRSGKWEFIEYETIQHYNYVRDPWTGQVFKQPTYVTKEEKKKTVVEFENDLVTAMEHSEDNSNIAGQVKIVVPPVFFAW